MSNEFVMVPRVPTDEMIVAFAEAWYSKRHCIDDPDMLDAYAAMLAVAPEHQGEPVAYLCKAEGAKWLQYGRKVGDPWKPGEVQATPLYTHPAPADPGEVARLRDKLTKINELIFATGAPLGGDVYFQIREICAEELRYEVRHV